MRPRLAFIHPAWLSVAVIALLVAGEVFGVKPFTVKAAGNTATASPLYGLYILIVASWALDVILVVRRATPFRRGDDRLARIAFTVTLVSAVVASVIAFAGVRDVAHVEAWRIGLLIGAPISLFSFVILCGMAARELASHRAMVPASHWAIAWRFWAIASAPLGAWVLQPQLQAIRTMGEAAGVPDGG